MLYVDTSALVKLYFKETNSDRVASVLKTAFLDSRDSCLRIVDRSGRVSHGLYRRRRTHRRRDRRYSTIRGAIRRRDDRTGLLFVKREKELDRRNDGPVQRFRPRRRQQNDPRESLPRDFGREPGPAEWESMAKALGYPSPIGWHDIADLAAGDQGWAAHGHPEWGRFRWGHAHPDANSGFLTMVSEVYAALGKTDGITTEDLKNPEVTAFLQKIEGAVEHYGLYNDWIDDLMRVKGPQYLSAAVQYENTIIQSNLKHENKPDRHRHGRAFYASQRRAGKNQFRLGLSRARAVRPRCAWIEMDHSVYVLYFRPMGMAVDHHVKPRLGRVEIQVEKVVEHVKWSCGISNLSSRPTVVSKKSPAASTAFNVSSWRKSCAASLTAGPVCW